MAPLGFSLPCPRFRQQRHPAARSGSARVSVRPRAAAAPAQKQLSVYDVVQKMSLIKQGAEAVPGIKANIAVEPKRFVSDLGERVGFIAVRDVQENGVVLTVPESVAITSIDAEKQELVGPVAAECSELIALTLWLMAERAKGPASSSANLIATLPETTSTPLLWPDSELQRLLQGSPVLPEARARAAELQRQWEALNEKWFSQDTAKFNPATFNYAAFADAFAVVMAHAVYLPSANMFALLPVASLLGRTGNSNGCNLDYDAEQQAVVVKAGRPYREGQEVLLNDGRPNGELLLATGMLQENNLSDFMNFNVSLLPADRYFVMKSQILDSIGLRPSEQFPVYTDRFPNQLLAYLRLARLSDPALFAKISFDKDVVLSQMNEYEILQILMGDCRERLQAYELSLEEDIKMSQQPDLPPRERLAVKQRLGEKRILSETMDAVRRRLAPIRGIPTKSGTLQDPNSDFREIFETLESIPQAPKKLLDGFMSWARGDDDPDFKKKRQGRK